MQETVCSNKQGDECGEVVIRRAIAVHGHGDMAWQRLVLIRYVIDHMC